MSLMLRPPGGIKFNLDGGYARALTREVAPILGRDAGGKAQHRTECQRDGCGRRQAP